jgi:energy-coupling factor transport system ATP-binding protein
MIGLQDVVYRYPEQARRALDDVTVELPQGSFTLVVGASGGGKSTLLRTLNGLVPHFYGGAFGGRVRVAGVDPVALTPRRMGRHVGFVFQDPEAQFVVSLVEDELAFGLENFGVAPSVIGERIEAVLGRLNLSHLRGRRVETLSGGERQRVAIAAILTLQPAVLVLDEPTSQLDPEGAADVLALLDDLNRDPGMTIVLAEHRVERVVESASHVMTVDAGHVAIGAPRAMLARHPLAPPVTRLGGALGWEPPPLTLAEAKERLETRDWRLEGQSSILNPQSLVINHQSSVISHPVLDIRDVWYEYPSGTGLRGVDLTMGAGEVVALMGRNGSGKTTLLKLAMGLLRPKRGAVTTAGQTIRGGETADLARRVGYVPQNPGALLFADTVRDEVRFTRRVHGLVGEGDILARLGLEDLAEAYPRDLSVGQRQRVALAAVLAADPTLVLLDEPTRGLDTPQKTDLAHLLREQARSGRAVLITTHDVELAAQVADRIVVLEQGQVAYEGPTAEVMRRTPQFASQVARLFPYTGWLTVEDALAARLPVTL